jgi:hypothetical protein
MIIFVNGVSFSNEWNDFYPDSPPNIKIESTHQDFSSGFIYIQNVQFLSITNTTAGGALKFETSNGENYLLIEESLFSQCKTTEAVSGGAVYFNNYGYCIFHEICGYDCNTGSHSSGQFCLCDTNTNNNYNLSMFSSSVHSSINNQREWPIFFSYGKQNMIKSNISNNQVAYYSGFTFEHTYISYTKYCTVENNNGNYVCIHWGHENHTSYIDYSNIINNSQNIYNSGLLWYNNHYIFLTKCSFINNQINGKGKLFSLYPGSSGTYSISDTYIDISFFSNLGDLTIVNTYTLSYINTFFEIGNCWNECDYLNISLYTYTQIRIAKYFINNLHITPVCIKTNSFVLLFSQLKILLFQLISVILFSP